MSIMSTERHDRFEPQSASHQHVVHFSEHDSALITTVGAFLSAGLRAGESCIVVATPSHRERFEHYLHTERLDPAFAQAIGTLILLDAAEILARFMVDGQPEPARFAEVIGPIIEQAAQGKRRVRIFGEMVALLWAQGKREAVIRLEELWNELGQTHAFSLFCAYPALDFDGHTDQEVFARICQQHSQLIPTESYMRLSEQERLRIFTQMQQQARTLEIEIAESKAAQERLQTLASIVESSDDAILSKDLSGIVTSWNKAAERVYGYSAEEIIGEHVTRLFPPGQREEFEQIMERIGRGERVEHHETRRIRKDGTPLQVSVTISPVKDDNGIIHGASSIARDITEQKRLEARSQQLFASNLIGIFVIDEAGKILEANQTFLDLLGRTREEWQEGILHGDDGPATVAALLHPLILQARRGNNVSEPQETIVLHKNGRKIPVLVAVTSIEYSETCIGFVLDISERKALEQRKDTFIGMASHELKTPVTSLKGFLSLLRRLLEKEQNERMLHYIARMDVQIDKLTKLINDLLDVSRMQSGHLIYREEWVEVDTLVQDIVESVQETTQTHHLQIEGESHTQMFGDRDRLGQVLINLLNNAIKYSPTASSVVVHLAADREQVQISVQDFGLGIDKEHHQRIFERFYQVTDPQQKTYPGLGIGLAISHDIVKRHKGRLWVESERGKGATFHLSLPLFQPASQTPTPKPEEGRE